MLPGLAPILVNRNADPDVFMTVTCSDTGAAPLDGRGVDGLTSGVEAELETPAVPGMTGLLAEGVPAGELTGACCETAPAVAVAFRGVGNKMGVTATIIAVRSNAIESLLSIYGTGSNPPGRKG